MESLLLKEYLNTIRGLRKIQVVLGSPRHECKYMGICRIEPDVWDAQTCMEHCDRIPALVAIDTYCRLQLHFPRSGISSDLLDRHFKQDTFLVQDPYPLPAWLLRAHQMPPGLTVGPRSYPVLPVGDFLLLSLRLYQRNAVELPQQNAA